MGRKLPKKAKKRQILQSYHTAQFVQYGKIRVTYHSTYYTNTPYDPSLLLHKTKMHMTQCCAHTASIRNGTVNYGV